MNQEYICNVDSRSCDDCFETRIEAHSHEMAARLAVPHSFEAWHRDGDIEETVMCYVSTSTDGENWVSHTFRCRLMPMIERVD